MDAGNVDALVGGYHPTVDHPADDLGVGSVHDPHLHQAVVDQNTRTASHVLWQLFIRNGTSLFVAHAFLGKQGIGLAGLEGNLGRVKLTGADFRTFGIAQQGDGKTQVLPQLFDHIRPCLMRRVVAMGKIETRHVHSGKHQLLHDIAVVSGRTHGTDNFRFTHILTSKSRGRRRFTKRMTTFTSIIIPIPFLKCNCIITQIFFSQCRENE